MNKIISYIKSSFDEVIHKVSWSKYSEVQSTAVLVIVSTLVFAGLVFGIDFVLKTGTNFIYSK